MAGCYVNQKSRTGQEMTCRRCRKAPATGTIFALCEPCMEEFERGLKKREDADGKVVPTDAELEYINEPYIRRTN